MSSRWQPGRGLQWCEQGFDLSLLLATSQATQGRGRFGRWGKKAAFSILAFVEKYPFISVFKLSFFDVFCYEKLFFRVAKKRSGIAYRWPGPSFLMISWYRSSFIKTMVFFYLGNQVLRRTSTIKHWKYQVCFTLWFGKFFSSGNPSRHFEQHGEWDRSC
jgi:hypothetical protein